MQPRTESTPPENSAPSKHPKILHFSGKGIQVDPPPIEEVVAVLDYTSKPSVSVRIVKNTPSARLLAQVKAQDLQRYAQASQRGMQADGIEFPDHYTLPVRFSLPSVEPLEVKNDSEEKQKKNSFVSNVKDYSETEQKEDRELALAGTNYREKALALFYCLSAKDFQLFDPHNQPAKQEEKQILDHIDGLLTIAVSLTYASSGLFFEQVILKVIRQCHPAVSYSDFWMKVFLSMRCEKVNTYFELFGGGFLTSIPAENSENPRKNNQASKKVYENGENKPEINQQVESLAGSAGFSKNARAIERGYLMAKMTLGNILPEEVATLTAIVKKNTEWKFYKQLPSAAGRGELELVNILLTDTTLDAAARKAAVREAASNGHIAVVNALLTAKAKQEATEAEGCTARLTAKTDDTIDDDSCLALIAAVKYRQMAVVRTLLAANVNPNGRDQDGCTPLVMAAACGNLDAVEILIAAKANLEEMSRNGTALVVATREKQTAVVAALVEAKANLDTPDEKGRTALIWSAFHGDTTAINLLVARLKPASNGIYETEKNKSTEGQDVKGSAAGVADTFVEAEIKRQEACDNNRFTALLTAAACGQVAAVETLLATNANREAVNKEGNTSLIEAALHGHTEVVKALVKAKVNLEAKNKEGDTALLVAAMNGHQGVVDVLMEANANLHAKNKKGYTALVGAALNGQRGVVETLVKAEANQERNRALAGAALNGHRAVVDVLVKANAHVETKNNNRIALREAIRNNETGIVEVLVRAKVGLRMADQRHGYTPLMLAVVHGCEAAVKVLLEAGEKDEVKVLLETKDKYGYTPLLRAAKNLNASIVEMLLNAKADLQATNMAGRTALMLAASWERDAGLHLQAENTSGRPPLLMPAAASKANTVSIPSASYFLIAKKKADDTALMPPGLTERNAILDRKSHRDGTLLGEEVKNAQVAVLEILVNANAALKTKDNQDWTALMWAAVKGGCADAIKVLIKGEGGAVLDAEDKDGYTALTAAARNGYADVVKVLLEAKVHPDAKGKRGYSALLLASIEGHADVIKVLGAFKADLNAKDEKGYTALMLAASDGQVAIVKALVEAKADLEVQGHTALMLAVKQRHVATIEVLKKAAGEQAAVKNAKRVIQDLQQQITIMEKKAKAYRRAGNKQKGDSVFDLASALKASIKAFLKSQEPNQQLRIETFEKACQCAIQNEKKKGILNTPSWTSFFANLLLLIVPLVGIPSFGYRWLVANHYLFFRAASEKIMDKAEDTVNRLYFYK